MYFAVSAPLRMVVPPYSYADQDGVAGTPKTCLRFVGSPIKAFRVHFYADSDGDAIDGREEQDQCGEVAAPRP